MTLEIAVLITKNYAPPQKKVILEEKLKQEMHEYQSHAS